MVDPPEAGKVWKEKEIEFLQASRKQQQVEERSLYLRVIQTA
jgi:hypothetical protein